MILQSIWDLILYSINWIKNEANIFFFGFFEERRREQLINYERSAIPFLSTIKEYVIWFAKRFLIYMFLVSKFCFVATMVASGSLTPTLKTYDIALISPMAYGINKIFDNKLSKPILKFSEPEVGDVVAFVPSVHPAVYVKRILGAPGDKIKFRNGIPIINGVSVKLEFLKKYEYQEGGIKYKGMLYKETLPNGKEHVVFYEKDLGNFGYSDYSEEFVVPENHFFMIGDNRHMSADSRTLIGFIEKSTILGRVYAVLFTNGNMFDVNIYKWIKSVEINRIFSWVV